MKAEKKDKEDKNEKKTLIIIPSVTTLKDRLPITKRQAYIIKKVLATRGLGFSAIKNFYSSRLNAQNSINNLLILGIIEESYTNGIVHFIPTEKLIKHLFGITREEYNSAYLSVYDDTEW